MSLPSRTEILETLASALELDPGDEHLASFAGRTVYTKYADGERIYERSQRARDLKCVLSGRVKITTVGPGGREVLMGMIEPGESFSVVAAIDGGPEASDAVADGVTETLALDRSDLFALLERSPEATRAIAGELCRRTRIIASLIENFGILDAGGRLLGRLLTLAERYGATDPETGGLRIDHGLSQQSLADSIGLTRVSVNRQLASWRARGLARTGSGWIEIADVEALDAFVWSR